MAAIVRDQAERPADLILSFPEALGRGPSDLGSKAATLVDLYRAGFPVPPGLVVAPQAASDWEEVAPRLRARAGELRGERLAVRSSATAEDLSAASFAGQYETRLDVPPERLDDAVRAVFASSTGPRVSHYRKASGEDLPVGATAMSVLVQPMVDGVAAGVALTADPLTGDRDEVVVSAVPGVGEPLVSGQATGEEWRVRGNHAVRRAGDEDAITRAQALAVAKLARRVEAHFEAPQDIEWAIEDGEVLLLQARPMTALPDPVSWTPPYQGWWLRNFRLGEWLPDAVTPLFVDWLLPRIEAGFAEASAVEIGVRHAPGWTVLNGWYYASPAGRSSPARLLLQIIRRPGALRWVRAFLVDAGRRPERAAPLLEEAYERWSAELLPRYQAAVSGAEREVADADPQRLEEIVDEVGELAGACMWSLASLGGSAWKVEGALARFFRKELAGEVEISYQTLLAGLPGSEPVVAPHAVHSADWYWPTLGERGDQSRSDRSDKRQRELAAHREAAEAACRQALGTSSPAVRENFERLVEFAQRFAVIREQQARSLTLAWPLLRRCVMRLAEPHVRVRTIDDPESAFFLTRRELLSAAPGRNTSALQVAVDARRASWERQRGLLAPLELGRPPRLARSELLGALGAAPGDKAARGGGVVGHPASPGRARGPVRVVRAPDQFKHFKRGEVLVAPATTPAWTPVFASAAAVVTDGGSLAAHASLVAREYGLPAVVATEDATRRLQDGEEVVVDGSAGTVTVTETAEGVAPTGAAP